jgi:hypothetical protein
MKKNILLIILLINLLPIYSQVKQSSESKYDTESIDIFPSHESYNFWREDCDAENSDQILFLDNSRIIFCVNQVNFICSVIIKKMSNNNFEIYLTDLSEDDFSNGAFFSSDDMPGGKKFENFSEKEPIAKVFYVDSSKIEFTWIGFYNTVTKKRELLKENYPEDTQNSPKILKSCVDNDLQLKQ